MTDDIGGGSLNIIYERKSFVSCTLGESLGLIIYLESISTKQLSMFYAKIIYQFLDYFEVI